MNFKLVFKAHLRLQGKKETTVTRYINVYADYKAFCRSRRKCPSVVKSFHAIIQKGKWNVNSMTLNEK